MYACTSNMVSTGAYCGAVMLNKYWSLCLVR